MTQMLSLSERTMIKKKTENTGINLSGGWSEWVYFISDDFALWHKV